MAHFYNKTKTVEIKFDSRQYIQLRSLVICRAIVFISNDLPEDKNDISIAFSLRKENNKLGHYADTFINLSKLNKPPRRLNSWAFTLCNLIGFVLFIEKLEVYGQQWAYSQGQCFDMKNALLKINCQPRNRPHPLIDSFIQFLDQLCNHIDGNCFLSED